MSCILSSQGVVLATTMVVSGTLILLSLFRDKNFPPTHELLSENQDSHSSIPILRSCFSSSSSSVSGVGKGGERKKKKKKKKKKKVKFADNIVREEDSKGESGELRIKKREEEDEEVIVDGNQIQRMPPNRVALYGGILRDRLHRMDCTY